MQLSAEQKRAYHTDGICRVIEIKEHLIKTDNREALLKHAPFKTLGKSELFPAEVFADAYVKAIETGDLEPIVFNEDYNTMVKRKIHESEVRRMQGDKVIKTEKNKPFKRQADAEKFQSQYELEITHSIKAVEGGFVLELNSLAKQQELQDHAKGYKTYEQLRSQAFQELGLEEKENGDGELIATDEQWAMIDARVNELERIQRGFSNA